MMARFFSSTTRFMSKTYSKPHQPGSVTLSSSDPSTIQEESFTPFKPPQKNSLSSSTEHQIWFPRCLEDLTKIPKSVLHANKELISDHPGFSDPIYVQRRRHISEIAENFSVLTEEVPIVDYSKTENETWSSAYDGLTGFHKTYACDEYLQNFERLKNDYGLTRERIPQLQELNEYLK